MKNKFLLGIFWVSFLIPLIAFTANPRGNLPVQGVPPAQTESPRVNSPGQQGDTLLERIQSRVRERVEVNLKELEKNRAELQQLRQQERLEIQRQIRLNREQLEQKKLEYQNQLRERLNNIKTERKRKVIERIYEGINTLNEIMTNHYLRVLNQLEDVLERIESRTVKAKLKGFDTARVEEAIATAYNSIESARNSVKSQAQKIYQPPEINSEETLRIDVGKLRQQLHTDLKAVEKLVKEAREKVRMAAVTLAEIRGVDNIEISTTTPATTSNPEGTSQ